MREHETISAGVKKKVTALRLWIRRSVTTKTGSMPKDTRITLALLEEETLLRSVLAICIEHLVDYRLVLATGCDEDAQQAVAGLEPPTIALVGYRPAGTNHPGTVMLACVRVHWPGTLVMALTGSFETALVQGAAQAGCTGIACRMTTGFEKLRAGLHQLYTSGSCFPPEAVRALAQPPPPESELDRIQRLLNDTQLRILDAACAPNEPTWKVVAERVNRTESCIEWNIPRMFAALGVKSKSGLVAMGRKNGFGQGRWLAP